MSKKSTQVARKIDRRVQRTRDSLGDALIDLMHQKPFADITVQEVLERADVGRSTFYSHYRDKDDLFLSDAEDFFESMAMHLTRSREDSKRVAPVREMFAHISEVGVFYAALVASGKLHDIMELAQGHFACGIELRLNALAPSSESPAPPRAALAYGLAGTMLSLLTWWIDHQMPATPAEMDDAFHRLVWSGMST